MRHRGDVALALALTLSGCLTAARQEPENQPDGGGEAGDDAAPGPAGDAAPVEFVVPCTERLPGLAVVEDPATHHCYFVGSTVDVFDVAAQDCVAVGAHAVQLGEEEANLLADQLLVAEASWWIGLRHSESQDGWTWVTGDVLGAWDDWSEAQPSGDSECVELFTTADPECAGGCWNDLFCGAHQKAAVCELEP